MIRLLLADDEHLIRTALAALLGLEDDLDVVAQAASGPEAVAMARRHHPDVAVLDLQMPGLDGIAVAEQLHTQLPDCATLIVTSHGRPGHLKRALAAGVGGFLPKTVSGQVLADVVRTVHAGGRYVDPQLAAEAISTGDNPLTSRETDVLELSANGTPIDPSWPYGVAAAIDICQLGRFYDRFADHAAAVTDRVIYQVTGHPRNADTA